jgi:hypothetical protein
VVVSIPRFLASGGVNFGVNYFRVCLTFPLAPAIGLAYPATSVLASVWSY